MTDLEFSPFQKRCVQLVEESDTQCRGRHSLRCAVNHLHKGWRLRTIDPEMAVFRAITAEEEAVAGLFYALKFRGYENATLLNPRNHVHKAAAFPFLEILGMFFEEFSSIEQIAPRLHITESHGKERLHIALSVKVDGRDMWAYPEPPLNLQVTSDGKKPSFKPQIERLLRDTDSSDIVKHVEERANTRNKILYAAPDGYPSVTDIGESFFELKKTQVASMVMAFLLVEPWSERQLFVQQSVDAFLVMLRRIEGGMLHPDV